MISNEIHNTIIHAEILYIYNFMLYDLKKVYYIPLYILYVHILYILYRVWFNDTI